jgi:hypothetical protein
MLSLLVAILVSHVTLVVDCSQAEALFLFTNGSCNVRSDSEICRVDWPEACADSVICDENRSIVVGLREYKLGIISSFFSCLLSD